MNRPISAECGTLSAHKRHQRHGEPPCDKCRAAFAAYQRMRYAARKAPAYDPFT